MNKFSQTTPPHSGLSRKQFLLGLGIAGLSLYEMLKYPALADAAVIPTDFSQIENGQYKLAIEFNGEDQEIVWQYIDPRFATCNYYGYENVALKIKDGTTIAANSELNVPQAARVLFTQAVLDCETGDKYDLEITVGIRAVNFDTVALTTPFQPANNPGRQGQFVYTPNYGKIVFEAWPPTDTNKYCVFYNTLTCRVLKEGQLVDKPVGIQVFDLEVGTTGRTRERKNEGLYDTETFEGVKFLSPINDVYVADNTLLQISENGTKFIAPYVYDLPADWADTNMNPEVAVSTSTVGGEFAIAWQGCICGTNLFGNTYSYPDVSANPIKTSVTEKLFV